MTGSSYVMVDGKLVLVGGKPLKVPNIYDIDLADVDVYIADFTDSAELSVLAGAVDKYARIVVS